MSMVNEVTTARFAQLERLGSVARPEAARPAEDHRNSETRVKKPPEQSAPGAVEVDRVVNELNELVQNTQRALQFSVDQDSGRTVIRVMDKETDEVIRQIPPEEALKLAQRFEDSLGALMQTEA